MSPIDEPLGELSPMRDEGPESRRHGFRAEQHSSTARCSVPRSLTVAISREAGARGSGIGRRAGRALGWQVYDQELLEYIAQEGTLRQDAVDRLPPARAHR